MIKAPYNFVPLSELVVAPFWAKHVSHDIPFEDPQTGTLHLTLKAESPVYVRNGVFRNVPESSLERNVFNNVNNRYFIPGSSIKGMIRSIMEIMSFGRMANKVNDDKYSVRDFQNNSIYNKTELSNKAECGWLYKKGEEYFLDKCGKPGRISHKNLDVLCVGEKISAFYKNAHNITPATKSAFSKYQRFSFSKEGHRFSKDYEDVGKIIYKIDQHEGVPGTIVMSGQPGVRREPQGEKATGKHLEFVFFPPKQTNFPVSPGVIKNFFFAYYDHDRNSQKEDWKWRKQLLDDGEKIPVFFQSEKNGTIRDMGLSLLYKITYNNSVIDLVRKTQNGAVNFDLAETIFGFAEGNAALKGRVQVSHAFAIGNVQREQEKNEVLAAPKASYYPNYIEQSISDANGKITSSYKTYMDASAKIRGWKRYPVRSGSNTSSNAGTDNVTSAFVPLATGTQFSFQINYHNLRKEELGALISAITFHNTTGLFHSIGTGKPLGFGKISLKITDLEDSFTMEMLKAFELYMNTSLSHFQPTWHQCNQIKELFTMAKPISDDNKLNYMNLSDFVNAKGRKRTDPRFALPQYSTISQNTVHATSLISKQELEVAIKRYNLEKQDFEKVQDLLSRKNKYLQKCQAELKSALTTKKFQLLEQLKAQRANIKIQEEKTRQDALNRERSDTKNFKQQIAAEQGFIYDGFKADDRNVWENLKKQVLNYAKDLHGLNEKQLEKQFPEGPILQQKDYLYVSELTKEVFKNIKHRKDKEHWLKQPFEKNAVFQKLKFWMGHEAATKTMTELEGMLE